MRSRLVLALASFALVLTGCGSSASTASVPTTVAPGTTKPSTRPPSTQPPGSLSFVDVASGKVVGTGDGLPVYALESDTAGTGTCAAACAEKWPPVRPSAASVAPGLEQAKVGEITRTDGTTQLTYGGRPVYNFIGDGPGVATCQGGDGVWWLLNADGTLNKKPA